MGTAEPRRHLLDTHTFLWLATGDARLPPDLPHRLADPEVELLLSVASIWEMAIKKSLGKLTTTIPLEKLIAAQCQTMAVSVLDVRREHALGVATLPLHHRDPFDRLLVAQAVVEGLAIVSRDEAFDGYPVERVW
jgi:PIN domain nuclease of toxin-antitoxin system